MPLQVCRAFFNGGHCADLFFPARTVSLRIYKPFLPTSHPPIKYIHRAWLGAEHAEVNPPGGLSSFARNRRLFAFVFPLKTKDLRNNFGKCKTNSAKRNPTSAICHRVSRIRHSLRCPTSRTTLRMDFAKLHSHTRGVSRETSTSSTKVPVSL